MQAPWAPRDAAAFAAAAGDFAASRTRAAEAQEALSTSSSALVAFLAEEAKNAGVNIDLRKDFSAYYCKVLLVSLPLRAAYSVRELAAFRRITVPGAERQGSKNSDVMRIALIRARNHLGYRECAKRTKPPRASTPLSQPPFHAHTHSAREI